MSQQQFIHRLSLVIYRVLFLTLEAAATTISPTYRAVGKEHSQALPQS